MTSATGNFCSNNTICSIMVLRPTVICILLILISASCAYAAGSDWIKKDNVAARLLVGDYVKRDSGTKAKQEKWLLAGLQFRLNPGWKLPWRSPGDKGLVMQYDNAGSDNIEDIQLYWAAPQRFTDSAGLYILGYENEVLLPVIAKIKNPEQGSRLVMNLSFSVCNDSCSPTNLQLKIETPADITTDNEAMRIISRYSRRVPKSAGNGSIYEIVWQRENSTSGVLDVRIRSSDMNFTVPDLFVEGGGGGVRFLRPRIIIDGDRKAATFIVPYEVKSPGATIGGRRLTFTLVNGYEATQVVTTMPVKPLR